MNIHFIIFIPEASNEIGEPAGAVMMKTFVSSVRPVAGDVIADPGFHPDYHNGYEVVRVTLDYAEGECWVSMSPMVPELRGMEADDYVKHLSGHGWIVMERPRT